MEETGTPGEVYAFIVPGRVALAEFRLAGVVAVADELANHLVDVAAILRADWGYRKDRHGRIVGGQSDAALLAELSGGLWPEG